MGEWHTSNAIYSDRSFGIDPVSIRFGTGGGTVTTGFIRKVSAVRQGARTLYTISYQTAESVNKVYLYYETAEGKVIHFRHQETIAWTSRLMWKAHHEAKYPTAYPCPKGQLVLEV